MPSKSSRFCRATFLSGTCGLSLCKSPSFTKTSTAHCSKPMQNWPLPLAHTNRDSVHDACHAIANSAPISPPVSSPNLQSPRPSLRPRRPPNRPLRLSEWCRFSWPAQPLTCRDRKEHRAPRSCARRLAGREDAGTKPRRPQSQTRVPWKYIANLTSLPQHRTRQTLEAPPDRPHRREGGR